MWAHVKLVAFILFDALILQWLKVLVSIVMRFLWFPSYKEKDIEHVDSINNVLEMKSLLSEDDTFKQFKTEYQKDLDDYDYTKLTDDGDGFKFLCLLQAAVEQSHCKCKDLKQVILSYIDENGVIGRHPVGHAEREKAVNFSGDMLAGFMYYLATMVKLHDDPQFSLGFTFNKKDALQTLFEMTTFSDKDHKGRKKGLLTFASPSEELEDNDRGSIYRWYGLGPDVVRLLAWFYLGYKFTGKTKYKVYYYLIRILNVFTLLTNPGDYAIFMGRVCAIMWFTGHSNMCHHAALYMLTKNSAAKMGANRIVKMFPSNADIVTRHKFHFKNAITFEFALAINQVCYNVARRGTDEYTKALKKYFTLRSFETKEMSDEWLDPKYLGHKYLFENNPLTPTTASDERRATFRVTDLCVKGLVVNKM